MPDSTAHPPDGVIEAFALGTLEAASLSSVEGHLAGCDRCQDRAEVVAPDTLAQLLTAARTRVDATLMSAPAATPSFTQTGPYSVAGGR